MNPTVRLLANSTMNLTGAGTKVISSATIENSGTINWTVGHLAFWGDARLDNLSGAVVNVNAQTETFEMRTNAQNTNTFLL